ncbi:uncharacterized protein LOC123219185 [Mangifera indica]|uniref:uncharacterized protein LOC123219185 n=1 Tax=Mangifera indica TaxID=29780 RepID=UPI001CFB6B57|nr:uncharacterized protein LOC123219185 [Mangifera indica]XP_044496911.1 uncharacterized protein LOC123219185 [Mangifera indica]
MHATFAPSGSNAAAAAPLDPSLCLGLPRVYQFSTGGDQPLGDGMPMPFFYGGGLQSFDHNLSKSSFPASTVSKAHSSLDLNQLPGFKETTAVGSFFVDPSPCLGHDESGCNKMKSFVSRVEGKRQHSLDSLGNTDLVKASKRPKIDSNLPMEIENIRNKKPLLMKKVEEPFPGLGISITAEQEVPADLDLSLHL